MNIPISHRPTETEKKVFTATKSIAGRKADISDDRCRWYAYQLYMVWGVGDLERMLPKNKIVGSKRTKAELTQVAKAAGRLFEKVASMHKEASQVVEKDLPNGTTLRSVQAILSHLCWSGRRSNLRESVPQSADCYCCGYYALGRGCVRKSDRSEADPKR